MVSPDSGQSSQESDATEPDAAEVDGAALTPSPQPSQDEDVLPSGTPDGQNDLDAEQPVSRGNAATSSPGAGEEVIPLSDSPAPERFSEPVPPRSEEPDWPEISPPQNRQAGFQRFQQPASASSPSGSRESDNQYQSPASLVQPVFNVTVTAGDDMAAKLGEEINPRLQQLQQMTEFYADDAIAEFNDLMALGEGGEL